MKELRSTYRGCMPEHVSGVNSSFCLGYQASGCELMFAQKGKCHTHTRSLMQSSSNHPRSTAAPWLERDQDSSPIRLS